MITQFTSLICYRDPAHKMTLRLSESHVSSLFICQTSKQNETSLKLYAFFKSELRQHDIVQVMFECIG